MTALLRLKHWHLFLLIYGPYVLLIGVTAISIAGGFTHSGVQYATQLAVSVSFVAKFLWQVALAKELQAKLPEGQQLHIPFFWTFLILQFLYVVSTRIYVVILMDDPALLEMGGFADFFVAMEAPVIGRISASTLLSWLCLIYFSNVLARLLSMVETQSDVMFGDYVGTFFLFVFFPIGVWIVQPRINKLFDIGKTELSATPLDHKLN